MKFSKNLENYFPNFRKSVRAHVMQVRHPRNGVSILFPSPDPPEPALVHACQSSWKIRKIWKKMCFLSFFWFRKMQENCRKIMCFLRNFPFFPRKCSLRKHIIFLQFSYIFQNQLKLRKHIFFHIFLSTFFLNVISRLPNAASSQFHVPWIRTKLENHDQMKNSHPAPVLKPSFF